MARVPRRSPPWCTDVFFPHKSKCSGVAGGRGQLGPSTRMWLLGVDLNNCRSICLGLFWGGHCKTKKHKGSSWGTSLCGARGSPCPRCLVCCAPCSVTGRGTGEQWQVCGLTAGRTAGGADRGAWAGASRPRSPASCSCLVGCKQLLPWSPSSEATSPPGVSPAPQTALEQDVILQRSGAQLPSRHLGPLEGAAQLPQVSPAMLPPTSLLGPSARPTCHRH